MVLHGYQGALSHRAGKHLPQAEGLTGRLPLLWLTKKPADLVQGSYSRFAKRTRRIAAMRRTRLGKPSNGIDSDRYTGKRGIIRYAVLDSTANRAASGEPVLGQGSEENEDNGEPCAWEML